jgi:hypothetical protein
LYSKPLLRCGLSPSIGWDMGQFACVPDVPGTLSPEKAEGHHAHLASILNGARRRNRRHDSQNKSNERRAEPADPRLRRHEEPRFVIATIAAQRKRNCGITVSLTGGLLYPYDDGARALIGRKTRKFGPMTHLEIRNCVASTYGIEELKPAQPGAFPQKGEKSSREKFDRLVNSPPFASLISLAPFVRAAIRTS